jgi:hypothetical protein
MKKPVISPPWIRRSFGVPTHGPVVVKSGSKGAPNATICGLAHVPKAEVDAAIEKSGAIKRSLRNGRNSVGV